MRRLTGLLLVLLLGGAGLLAAACQPAAAATWTGHFGLPGARSYYLHSERSVAAPRPLVVVLHPLGWTVADIQAKSGATAYADSHGFAVAYGEGVGKAWNAGPCCGGAVTDDVTYLVDLVHDAAKHTPVDPTRVYLWGMSNGGMLAWKALCERPGTFAAAGVVAGALMQPCPVKVVVRHVHGTGDRTVPYHGGKGCCGVSFPSALTEASRVAAGSSVLLKAWGGGHAWPSFADDWLWTQLKGVHLPAAPPPPTPSPTPTTPAPSPTGTVTPVPPV